ncbi:hypothetical protein Acr_18g0006250 [Actinidia rufa]|uniref:Putative plant transposon protein domain-containing protein n=1 Tax=Actinidia rufa TaxID=165716 RepID=A0A7J0G6N4_9ERIC|nr:hypothetical protein Acr_18g0006250 [Actinidia rufa]
MVGRGECRHDEAFVNGAGRKYAIEMVEVEPCARGFAAGIAIETPRFEPKLHRNGFRGRFHGEGIESPDGCAVAPDPQQRRQQSPQLTALDFLESYHESSRQRIVLHWNKMRILKYSKARWMVARLSRERQREKPRACSLSTRIRGIVAGSSRERQTSLDPRGSEMRKSAATGSAIFRVFSHYQKLKNEEESDDDDETKNFTAFMAINDGKIGRSSKESDNDKSDESDEKIGPQEAKYDEEENGDLQQAYNQLYKESYKLVEVKMKLSKKLKEALEEIDSLRLVNEDAKVEINQLKSYQITLLDKVRFLEKYASDREELKKILEEKSLKLEADLLKSNLTFKNYEASASSFEKVWLNQKHTGDTHGIGYVDKSTVSKQPQRNSGDSEQAEERNKIKNVMIPHMDNTEDDIRNNLEPSARVKLNHPLGQVIGDVSAPMKTRRQSSAGLVRLILFPFSSFMSPPHPQKRPRTRGGSGGSSTPRPQRVPSDDSSDTHKFRPNSEAEARFNRYFHSRPVFIHRGVLLDEFPDTMVFTYFHHMGWECMAVPEGFACPELVREFYANIHGKDKEAGTLKTYVRGTFLDVSISTICVTLLIPPLHPDRVGNWPSWYLLKQKDLKDVFRILNHVIYNLFQCTSHVSEVDEVRARFMHAIATNLPIDLGCLMFNLILASSLENTTRGFLPFGLLITSFLEAHQIIPASHDTRLPPGKPITRRILLLSNAHLGVAAPPPRLRPHSVEFVPFDDEITPPHGDSSPLPDPPVASSAVPALALTATISSLVAHMDMIHKDLIERIRLVHERVDRIAERQELDIKAVRDTLSALSQRHTEFITDVNEFIQSFRRR